MDLNKLSLQFEKGSTTLIAVETDDLASINNELAGLIPDDDTNYGTFDMTGSLIEGFLGVWINGRTLHITDTDNMADLLNKVKN